ncbi:MAG: hypothetical protein AXW15_13000 [Neptuniibacter sp. Phe_28]|jgi:hypothetical protein|nr:MAG: hypothetical protein AXW15_13000 [Neptuniibacter sp. Phe_28]
MNPPDYKNYSIRELLEALDGVDSEEYPDRAESIKSELQYRQKAGYSITASSPRENFFSSELSFYDVALPIWWQCTWRYFVGAGLISLVSFFLISMVVGMLGLPFIVLAVSLAAVNLAITVYVGIFITRQALTAKYKNFHIQIVPKENS